MSLCLGGDTVIPKTQANHMTTYADLEIALRRRDGAGYAVDLRFSPPGGEVDVRLIGSGSADVSLDLEQLRALSLDVPSYAHLLSGSLFNDPALKTAFSTARNTAHAQDATLRVRLFIDPSAPELHSLRWEVLQDPDDGSYLFNGEQILFSRYLSSLDWRPVALRPQSQLTALIVIANPANLDQFQLAPVNVAGELARAQSSMYSIRTTALASAGKATLNNLIDSLREGYDILHLVCHGTIVQGEPWLWMEDDKGNIARVAGSELSTRLNELQQRPRLVVLASCQGAGSGDGNAASSGTLAALGPRLAEAGIPAVLAMQGSVSMDTVAKFMPVFFRELLRDGQIDRAVGVARGEVRDRPDYWMPVLFMRLRSGRIWYVPGFADDQKGFERWPALLSGIRQGRCTPILGSGLIESLIGSSRDIAQRWAENYHFPMAPSDREDLPNVAQYLSVTQDFQFPRDKLRDYLRNQILTRYPTAPQDAALDQLLEFVGAQRRRDNPAEPHRVLAGLPFPIYITTNPDKLLEGALVEAGRSPQSEICRWNSDIEALPSIYDKQPDYRPDADHPLVYHLFGRLSEPESVVLTEDDYFDYLIGVTSNKDLIPVEVRRALADTALLFLGFHMDDWNFRVLFRSIMRQEGGVRRSRYSHVAAQIDPEQGRILEPERARHYLEQYFQGADVSIYWGSAEDFMKELATRSVAAVAGT